jgi:hypothetical protein
MENFGEQRRNRVCNVLVNANSGCRFFIFSLGLWVSSLSCVLKNYIPCAKHKERLFDTRDELLVIKNVIKMLSELTLQLSTRANSPLV